VYCVPWLKNGGTTDPARPSQNPNVRLVYPGMARPEIDELLEETQSLQLMYEPFTMYRERPRAGRFVNISEAGFRVSKDQAPWPPPPDRVNVFVFGGSTTFGYGLADDDTLVSALSDSLKAPLGDLHPAVYNFGRGSYFSSQERVLFEQLLLAGYVPSVAVFVDGLNDFQFYAQPDHSDQLEKTVAGSGNLLPLFVSKIPVLKSLLLRTTASTLRADEIPRDSAVLDHVVNRYAANKSLIDTLATARGIRAVSVVQPVPTYNYDLRYHPFVGSGFGSFAYPRMGYPRLAALRDAGELGDNLVWCADIQAGLAEPLYVDRVHYTARMSRLLAECIASSMAGRSPIDAPRLLATQ
jgi:hypothetical protein